MRNLTMLTDLYQLTMMYGYFKKGMVEDKAIFDVFFRKGAGESEYAIVAGLEQAIDLIKNLHFGEEDVEYLRSLDLFSEDFLEFLKSSISQGRFTRCPRALWHFPMSRL